MVEAIAAHQELHRDDDFTTNVAADIAILLQGGQGETVLTSKVACCLLALWPAPLGYTPPDLRNPWGKRCAAPLRSAW